MTDDWKTAFSRALAEGNISQLRTLANQSADLDPNLSVWLLRQISTYNLSQLNAIEVNHGS
jgi:hypothetical protein